MFSKKLPHLKNLLPLIIVVFIALSADCRAGIVINEVLYNAPNDLENLEFVELFNDGAETVDLSDWKLSKAISYTFPKGTNITSNDFIVVCKNKALFEEFYSGVEVAGEFEKSLSNSSDKINLKNAAGKVVESVEYSDRAPWPVSPDGYSASLERICPSSSATSPANWAPSILSDDYDKKPSGTPGRRNSAYAETFPPIISEVNIPANSAHTTQPPGSLIAIHAIVSDATNVALLYQVVEPGGAGDESQIEMKKETGNRYSGSIPGQSANRIVRIQVKATGKDGAVRFFPHPNEIRPALSIYVSGKIETAKIPVAHFFNVGEEAFKAAEEYRKDSGRSRGGGGFDRFGGPGGRPRFTEEDRARMDADRALRTDALGAAWNGLTLNAKLPEDARTAVLPAFRTSHAEITKLREQMASSDDIKKFADAVPANLAALGDALRKATSTILDESQQRLLANIGTANADGDRGRRPGRGGFGGNGFSMLQGLFDIESSWYRVSMNADVEASVLATIHPVFLAAIENRDATEIGGDQRRPDFQAIVEALAPVQEEMTSKLVAALSEEAVADLQLIPDTPFAPGDRGGRGDRGGPDRNGRRGPGGFGRGGGNNSPPLLPQGLSALIYTDPATGTTQLFDFVNIVQRKSGYKVRLHKDRPLDGMTSINVLYEPGEGTILNEALAYDLYRAAGNASQRAGYMRVVMDGELVGHHLWFEQPNGAFFRHNAIDDDGNLYKVIWQGGNTASKYTPKDKLPKNRSDIVGRHEKKSNPHDGYDDLIALIETLESTTGDEAMWKVIEENFDVDQVINYFAVNSLISHWDGFFNNYFLYHDTKRNKWTLYPWDQDSTWSQRGGNPDELYEMPLNFGAESASPPGSNEGNRDGDDRGRGRGRGRGGFGGGFGRGGFGWWRDGGEISKPLLDNPQFRDRFLARLKSLAESVFTEDAFGPKIDALWNTLKDEVALRAEANGQDEENAVENLRQITNALSEHLAGRRAFVLKQIEEIQ